MVFITIFAQRSSRFPSLFTSDNRTPSTNAVPTNVTLMFCFILVMYTHPQTWHPLSGSSETCKLTAIFAGCVLPERSQPWFASVHLSSTIIFTNRIASYILFRPVWFEILFHLYLTYRHLKPFHNFTFSYPIRTHSQHCPKGSCCTKSTTALSLSIHPRRNWLLCHVHSMHPVVTLLRAKIFNIVLSAPWALCRSSHSILLLPSRK